MREKSLYTIIHLAEKNPRLIIVVFSIKIFKKWTDEQARFGVQSDFTAPT